MSMATEKTQDILHHEKANEVYQYTSIEELVENPEHLINMIDDHRKYQVPRLELLNDYFLGYNTSIEGRDNRKNEKADHRASHNYARYIAQFIQGYMSGVPIKLDTGEKPDTTEEMVKESETVTTVDGVQKIETFEVENGTPLLDDLVELNDENEADALNSELILDLSKYGRAYEMVYRDTDDIDRFVILDVMRTFTIHDVDVTGTQIGAVYYTDDPVNDGDVLITLFSESHRYDIRLSGSSLNMDANPIFYDEVPIIEYSNNRFRQGDYENVITLIDLYDSAQSDTANYMTDLNDAILAFSGNMEGSGLDSQTIKELLDMNILFLGAGTNPDGSSSPITAQYLYKQYDVAGTEAYKKRLEEDIHKFSNTPNLNDQNFSGQTTGVAMKYKLFGLEQSRAIKERLFKRGLTKRYRLVNTLRSYLREESYDYIGDLEFKFTANLPESEEVELQAFYAAGGRLSNETLLSTLSFVNDPLEEMRKIEAEDELYGKATTDFQMFNMSNEDRAWEVDEEVVEEEGE